MKGNNKKTLKKSNHSVSGVIVQNGAPFEVPVEGSLGLLALGYIGLRAWREKRKAHSLQMNKNKLG